MCNRFRLYQVHQHPVLRVRDLPINLGFYAEGVVAHYLSHISHINPAGRAVISNIGDRCNRIAEHSSYHEC